MRVRFESNILDIVSVLDGQDQAKQTEQAEDFDEKRRRLWNEEWRRLWNAASRHSREFLLFRSHDFMTTI